MSRSLDTTPLTPPAAASGNKALWAVVAVLGATVVAMGGYLMRGPTQPVEASTSTAPAPVAAVSAPSPVVIEKKDETPVKDKKAVPAVKPATVASKSASSPPQVHAPAPVAAGAPVAQAPQVRMPPPPAPKPLCLSCGTVSSVTPIQRDGAGSGTGAIAGGVLGGVLGNQVGGGDGKTIATILGAIGGGFAGNAVEKKMKKETLYQVAKTCSTSSAHSFPFRPGTRCWTACARSPPAKSVRARRAAAALPGRNLLCPLRRAAPCSLRVATATTLQARRLRHPRIVVAKRGLRTQVGCKGLTARRRVLCARGARPSDQASLHRGGLDEDEELCRGVRLLTQDPLSMVQTGDAAHRQRPLLSN